MAPPLLTLRDIHLTFGGSPLLSGAELFVSPGDRLCLVGRNGSGKSTLMKIAAGMIDPDSGEVFLQPGATVRYLAQEPDLTVHKTVLDYVEAGLGPGQDAHRASYLIGELGIDPDQDTRTLSGGQGRRAALAQALAPDPDLLLIDEPTNHLDLPAIEWLEAELARMRGALVLISHDRRFLERLSRATVWLDRGRTRRIEKGFGAFEDWRDKTLAEEELDRHKLDRQIVREEHWVRHGVTARRKRNMGRMRDLADLRTKRREARGPTGRIDAKAAEAEKSGSLVIEAKGLAKAWDDLTVVRDFSIRIRRGDRIGLIGPNGTGKTTLLNMLTGALEPDSGTLRLGTNLEMFSLDQKREDLNPDWTLKRAMTDDNIDQVTVGDSPRHVIGYMKDFLFAPEQARTPINALSGGERGRLMLARALARPSNLLVLDEPTNDLDLETLDLLQEILNDYSGTVILVSHDRDFLDRVVASVVIFEGKGLWREYAGGYSDMLAQRVDQDAAGPAIEPSTRVKPEKERAPRTRTAKLSFKQKHALDTLPARMDQLAREIQDLESGLADPMLYSGKPDKFAALSKSLVDAQAALTSAEEEWLDLELIREEVDR